MTKARGIRTITFIFDIPRSVIPNSSGIGEAMMRAPISGDNHLIKPKCNDLRKYLTEEVLNTLFKSSAKRSLIKRKRTRSPHIAPNPPQNTTPDIGEFCAIWIRVIDAGARVKTEVKNIPEIKLAII